MIHPLKWTNYGNNPGVGLNALPQFTANAADPNSGNALASFLQGAASSVGISEVATWRAFLQDAVRLRNSPGDEP